MSELRLSREFGAKPARVFRAWSDPINLSQWISGHASVEIDLTVGGRLMIDMRDEHNSHVHQGEFLVVDPPHRLVFTWRSEATRDSETTVALEFRKITGGTEFTLVHEELADDEMKDDHGLGWAEMLDALNDYLSL